MSLERLAKVLYVDEVVLNHGPRGVAVHVRIGESWRVAAIDNEDLVSNRAETIAKHLMHLADGHVSSVRAALAKGGHDATLAALRADSDADQRRRSDRISWRDVPFEQPYDGPIQQQVARPEPVVRQLQSDAPGAPAVTEPMPSRFHAVMMELRSL